MVEPARHTLVYVRPDAWAAMVAGADANDTILRDWAAAGRPAIVRRTACGDTGGSVPLGVPLPPAFGKRRVALRCRAADITRTAPPPLLRDAAPVAPPAWRATIAAVSAYDRDARCFGSLAWQHLTGLPYVTGTSDIDLLLTCASAATADAAAAALAAIEAHAPVRIDGELAIPGGDAVQWREWEAGAAELLVKSISGVRVAARDVVFACA